MAMAVLARERTVASARWSRWLVPPAALSIHLAIGGVYGWSVFKLPLEESLGANGVTSALPFTLGIVMLGLSAALFGTAVDRRGPRWAMTIAATMYVGGLLVAALAAALGQLWLVIVGYGLIGGIGLGIGYISPVSTLMKWFPDRPGMATGFAIMGFGGGALIASPLATELMQRFGTDQGGIAQTFLTLAIGYAIFMALGILLIRVPREGWAPAAVVRAEAGGRAPRRVRPPGNDHTARQAVRTRQFWLLWIVLCFNVTAGIGILERAAPIYQDLFPGGLTPEALAAAAAGFVAVLSLANSLGRILWSSVSDIVGRKGMYRLYLGVGALLYLLILLIGEVNKPIFLVAAILLLSFYGAGFATVPAYLRDLYGTVEVGAIHGRLLTAWSTAGVLGPLIVNAIADAQIAAGAEGAARYQLSFGIMIALLAVGFVCNELIKPPPPPRAAGAREGEEVA